ncbi:MAG: hypothetical protein K8T25_19835 [Planctomycetia bacterium]|nr:hypothetical protein [Planctomycetia bacterium]
MSYWGSGPIDNDYAFDSVSAYVFMIKEQMFQGADKVVEKSYPEQGIIASLQCLRLLANQFPKCVKVHFRKKEFEQAKDVFGRWYDSTIEKLPPDYREAIRSNAEAEFRLFEMQVLTPS